MAKEAKKDLEQVLKDLEKEYGKGAVIHGNAVEKVSDVISTGSIGLDLALGVGGIARGKVYEMFGWESSGKSTLTQTIIGKFQDKNLKCLLIDGEGSLDPTYAANLGVDLDKLYLAQMDEEAGEGAYDRMEKMVSTGEIDLVVIDSYNSLQPKSVVVDGAVGDSAIGKHARMLGQAVIKANYLSSKYNCTFIFIGQLREKIGVMFGSPEVTQGGNALKFYSHVRMQVGRSTTKDNSVMEGDVKMGNLTKVKVIKNKLAPPFKDCEFDIIYGKGIDKVNEIVNIASERLDDSIFKKYGKTITYANTKYELAEFLEALQDEAFYNMLKEDILNEGKREEVQVVG